MCWILSPNEHYLNVTNGNWGNSNRVENKRERYYYLLLLIRKYVNSLSQILVASKSTHRALIFRYEAVSARRSGSAVKPRFAQYILADDVSQRHSSPKEEHGDPADTVPLNGCMHRVSYTAMAQDALTVPSSLVRSPVIGGSRLLSECPVIPTSQCLHGMLET